MKIVMALKRELKFANVYVPSIQEFQKEIPEIKILDSFATVFLVEIPENKFSELQKIASIYYHVEEQVFRYTC